MRWSKPGIALFGAAALLGFCGASARADEAMCKGLADAMMANAHTPYHSIGTISFAVSGVGPDGADATKSLTTETIFTGTEVFVRLPSGKWQNVHASLDDLRARVRKNADSFTDCRRLADEAADGKTLAVYTGSAKSQTMSVTTKVWVAPDRGVLVRSETDMTGMPDANGAVRHQHLALRYDYDDIKAPTDVQ